MINTKHEEGSTTVVLEGGKKDLLNEFNSVVRSFLRTDSLKKAAVRIMSDAIVDYSHDEADKDIEEADCDSCLHFCNDLDEYPCTICTKNAFLKKTIDSLFKNMWEEDK